MDEIFYVHLFQFWIWYFYLSTLIHPQNAELIVILGICRLLAETNDWFQTSWGPKLLGKREKSSFCLWDEITFSTIFRTTFWYIIKDDHFNQTLGFKHSMIIPYGPSLRLGYENRFFYHKRTPYLISLATIFIIDICRS